VLLILLVFCVVVFGGVRVAHPFSFLCCGFLVGSVLLILFVFYVVVFGGFCVAHLFSFLCCCFWWVLCCSSFLFSKNHNIEN
jgi:hypothetical protein